MHSLIEDESLNMKICSKWLQQQPEKNCLFHFPILIILTSETKLESKDGKKSRT